MHGARSDSEDSEPTPPLRLIADKYRLIRELGRGAMGAVWQAEHLTLHSTVAIKLLDPEIADSAHALQRFLGEARAAAALRSPHVVQILDHGVYEGTPYIVMEELEGESLAERLANCRKLSPRETARIVTHIARALARAHAAGIVHRDLKPANVFLVSNDDDEIAKLFDFGIAKSLHEAKQASRDQTLPGVPVGTPYYMSPEQVEGAATVDHRADIWSLGVIAFECLLGIHPFESSTVAGLMIKIRDEPPPAPSLSGPVPAGFDAWFARACERNVSARFQSAKQAADELRQLCEQAGPPRAELGGAAETLLSHSASRPDLSQRSRERRSVWPRALGAALGLCAASLGSLLLARVAFGPTGQSSQATAASHAPLLVTSSLGAPPSSVAPAIPLVPEQPRPTVSLIEVAPALPSPNANVAPSDSASNAAERKRQSRPVAPLLPTSTPRAPLQAPRITPSASARAGRAGIDLGI